MSKSDRHLDEVKTGRARKPLGKPTFAEDKPVNGLDTETADGDIFAIGVAYDDGDYQAAIGDEKPLTGVEVLSFITQKRMRSAINVWYNLNFDANVILKALPRRNLKELRLSNTTEFEDAKGRNWRITYIPKKCLEVRDEGDHVYRHFDASQFTYSGSLENAAGDWLGVEDGKLNDGLEVERFGKTEDGRLNDYIQSKKPDIRKYLRRDCELTADIFEEIRTIGEEVVDPPIPFGKPYSTGYVAADYVRNRLEYKPGYASTEVQTAAWESYRGGRFEVFKRGHVGEVYGADINSAYPAVMANLPDPSTLKWGGFGRGRINEITDEVLEEADFGFVRVKASTDPERAIQPFAVKNPDEAGRVEYPALQNAEVWALVDTFRFARDAGYLLDYDVKEAVLGFETDDTTYPFRFFEDLYTERKTLEAEGKKRQATLLKIVMNSLYGKTCQTTVKYDRIDEKTPVEEVLDGKTTIVTDEDGQPYAEYVAAGRLFNPVLAAYITGLTRLQLHESVVNHGLEDATVMFATDCIMVEADAFEASGLYDEAEAEPDSYAEALGGWDYDYVGDAFVVGSGVYGVVTEDGYKKSVRGFRELNRGDDRLRELAADNPEGIPVETTRPVTIGDALHRGTPLSEVGVFTETERTLTAAMDTKRTWRNDPDFADLLEGVEVSKPKLLRGDADRIDSLKW